MVVGRGGVPTVEQEEEVVGDAALLKHRFAMLQRLDGGGVAEELQLARLPLVECGKRLERLYHVQHLCWMEKQLNNTGK